MRPALWIWTVLLLLWFFSCYHFSSGRVATDGWLVTCRPGFEDSFSVFFLFISVVLLAVVVFAVLSTIFVTVVLVSAQSSLGAIVSHKQGLVLKFRGGDYGIYDERYANLVGVSDGKIVGGMYWSGVELGPLGRFGTSSTHSWVQETTPFVLGAVGVLCAAIALRCVDNNRKARPFDRVLVQSDLPFPQRHSEAR